jgi:hypothetical protein
VTGAVSAAVLWLQVVSSPPAAFAIANVKGDRLLAWEPLGSARLMTRGACGGDRVVTVKPLGYREQGSRSTGRETPANFDQLAGELFRPDAPLQGSPVCVLMTDVFARGRRFAALDAPGTCDEATRARISTARGRSVANCWDKGGAFGRRVVLVEFARQGNSLLASLAVVGTDTLAFEDYPAKWNEERLSCWRVDDGCTFAPGAFDVLFAYVTDAGVVGLALAWGGVESQTLNLLEVDGDRLRGLVSASRYWAPN